MGKNIRITAGSVVVDAELNDTDAASAIWVCYPSKPTSTPRVMRYISKYPSKTRLRTGSDVAVIGKINGDSIVLKSVSSGRSVLIRNLS